MPLFSGQEGKAGVEGREEGDRSQQSQGSRLGAGLRVPQAGAGRPGLLGNAPAVWTPQVCEELPISLLRRVFDHELTPRGSLRGTGPE